MSLEKVKISDVYEGLYDGPHATPPDSDEGAIFLGISNITKNGHLDFSSIKHIAEKDLPKWTKRVTPRGGDIVFSYEAKATLNLYAIIPDGFWGCLGRRMALIRPDETKAHGKFLYYYFFSEEWRATIAQHTITGATVDRIPIAKFPDFLISLPPLTVQHRIAETLSAYDDLIENNQKQVKLLEEAAQRLYKEWFVDLHFPGHETTPITDGIPEGWKTQTLTEIASVIMGQSPKSEFYNQEGRGFHQGVGSYGTRFVIDNTYSTSYTRIAEAGSVLFSVRAPVGRLNMTKNQVVIGRGLAAINHRAGMQSYLFYLLKERFFKDDIIGNGAIFASIFKDELLGQKFTVPSDDLVAKFNAIVSDIDKKIAGLADQIDLLTEARDRLLPKLMNGEIEV